MKQRRTFPFRLSRRGSGILVWCPSNKSLTLGILWQAFRKDNAGFTFGYIGNARVLYPTVAKEQIAVYVTKTLVALDRTPTSIAKDFNAFCEGLTPEDIAHIASEVTGTLGCKSVTPTQFPEDSDEVQTIAE